MLRLFHFLHVIKVLMAALLATVALSSPSVASPRLIGAGQVFFPTTSRAYACAEHAGSWQFGRYIARRAVFRPYADELALLRRQLKNSTSGRTTAKLRSDIKKLQAAYKAHRTTCAAGPSGGPAPIPTATPSPKATPTPSPTPRPGCFDSAGNTTCFGIPVGTVGNRERGRQVWTFNCAGCHSVQWLGKSYAQISAAFTTVSEMAPFEPSSQDRADVAAYLNRLNTGSF